MAGWPPFGPLTFDEVSLGVSFAPAAANGISLEYVVLALVASYALCAASYLALLVARRRRALILEGIHRGFFVASDPVEELASPSPVATARSPRHESLIAPSVVAKWDPGCRMITESTVAFTGDVELVELFDFFHNPLEARAFALLWAVGVVAMRGLDVLYITLALQSLLPYLGQPQLIVLTLMAAVAVDRIGCSETVWYRGAKLAAMVGSVCAMMQIGLTEGFAFDPYDSRRPSNSPNNIGAIDSALWTVFAPCSLALANHHTILPMFVVDAKQKKPNPAAPGRRLSAAESPFFTPHLCRTFVARVAAFFAWMCAATISVVVLTYTTLPGYVHDWPVFLYVPLVKPDSVHWSLRVSCTLLVPLMTLHTLAPSARRSAASIRYVVTGARHSWDKSAVSVRWLIPVCMAIAVASVLSTAAAHVARICFLAACYVTPMWLSRCSRMCARRLGVPRGLDDALRLPPLLRRFCVLCGVLAVLYASWSALEALPPLWGDSPAAEL